MGGGALQIGSSYLRHSSAEIVRYGLFLPILCSVTLFTFLSMDRLGAFALYTVVGMVCYFSQLALSTGDENFAEQGSVKFVFSAILILYLNALVIAGTLLGAALTDLGYHGVVPTALLLFSFLDGELGRRELPSLTALLGLCVSGALLVAELFDGAEPMEAVVETFREIQSRVNEESPKFFHDELIRRTEQSSVPWI